MEAKDAAGAWIDAWQRGWHAHDAEPIVARYAENAFFLSHPFREPEDAKAYVKRVLAEEDASPDVWFGEPIVSGNRAAVEYWATIQIEGEEQTLAGTTVLQFDSAGLVTEHRDYWAVAGGRRSRPAPA